MDLLRQVSKNFTAENQYVFLIELPTGESFFSLSPERFCHVTGNRLETEAVAGTWAGDTEHKSQKLDHEHDYVCDFVYENLFQLGDNVVEHERHVCQLPNLAHYKKKYSMESKKSGIELILEACRLLHPTPAVCGFPKETSKRLLEKLEKRDRGYYAAPCGLLNRFGGDLLVGLRSGFLSRTKKRLFLYAGAGIISESRVEDELMEMILKMKQFRVFLTFSSFIENLSLRKTRNGFFSHVVVEELSRLGVKLFILCSGSRNTPLLQAVVERGFQHRSFSDERSAAYFCLGYSKVELA